MCECISIECVEWRENGEIACLFAGKRVTVCKDIPRPQLGIRNSLKITYEGIENCYVAVHLVGIESLKVTQFF